MNRILALAIVFFTPLASLVCAPGTAYAQAHTLAIADFDNHSTDPELAALAKGMADMLITDLSAVKALQLVERGRLAAVLAELKLQRTPFIDPASAQKLGRGLAAQWLMAGSITVAGDKMRLDSRILEVESGKVLIGKAVDGEKADFFALEKDLADAVIAAVAVPLDSKERAAPGAIRLKISRLLCTTAAVLPPWTAATHRPPRRPFLPQLPPIPTTPPRPRRCPGCATSWPTAPSRKTPRWKSR